MRAFLLLATILFPLLAQPTNAAAPACSARGDKEVSSIATKYGPACIYDLTQTPRFRDAQRDFAGISPVNEFEDVGTVYMNVDSLSYDGYRNIFALAQNLPASVRLVLYGSREGYNTYRLLNMQGQLNSRPENSVFFQIVNLGENDEDSIRRWARDHMGIPVRYTNSRNEEVVGYVSSNYRFNYHANIYPNARNIYHIPANFEWGNYVMVDSTAFIVAGPRFPSSIDQDEFAYAGAKRLVILPRPVNPDPNGPPVGVPHSDEFLMPTSAGTIVTNDQEYRAVLEALGYQAPLLPNNVDIGYDFFSYTNVLIVTAGDKKQIYMTSFGEYEFRDAVKSAVVRARDAEAQKLYESLGFEVIATSAPDFPALTMGGLHCATRTWPARDVNADKNPSFFPGNLILLR